jgi:hypothetical protein
MPLFSKIALVVSVCMPGAGSAPGDCQKHTLEPETWASATVVEAGIDYGHCTRLLKAYRARQDVIAAKCQYRELVGAITL